MILFIILIIMILYIFFKSKKYSNDSFINYKPITITPQPMIYNSIIINSWFKTSLYWNIAENIKSIYPIDTNKISRGSLDNINLVEKFPNQLALVQQDILYDYIDNKPDSNIRLITTIGLEDITLIIPANSNIYSWSDLSNKNIGTLHKNSGSYYLLNKLKDTFNFPFNIKNLEAFNSKLIIDSFTNKTIDAFFIVVSNPNNTIKTLSQNYPIRIIGTKGLNPNITDMILPYYKKSNIDTTDYKMSVINSINTYKTNICLICNKSFDSLESYILIKAIFTNFPYLTNNGDDYYKLQFLDFNPSYLYQNSDKIKLHDGVIKFFKEINIITDNPNPECLYKIGIDKCNLTNINNNRLLV